MHTIHVHVCCILPRYDPLSAATLLSDKSHLKHIRDLYKNFEYESNDPFECLNEETVRENYQKSYLFDSYTYDDEYDDTYDSHDVGVPDSVTTDEVFAVKRWSYFCTTRTLQLHALV